jgi:Holliday junction resolvase RusA-like endonuclease
MIEKILEFSIPQIPPSYTASFKINYGLKQTYLSQEARQFKNKVKIYMPSHKLPDLKETDKLILHTEYHQDWYFMNGKIKKQDVQNLNRLLIDAMFKGLGLDDRNLFCTIDEKVQSQDQEKTVVKLYIANEVKQYLNDKKEMNLPLQKEKSC